MNTLVCGAFGFIGYNYSKYLVSQNKDIILLDSLQSKSSKINFNNIDEGIHKIDMDINQIDKSFLKTNKVSSIINFAAESHVDNSISNPKKVLRSNILGFENMLRSSIYHDMDEIIHFSTDEVYGSVLKSQTTEKSKLNPSSPYSSSKASADLIGLAYTKTYKLNLKIIRPANNYGIYQQPEKLIPYSIISLLNNKKVELYGDGKNIRHWLHVNDTINAIEIIRKKGVNGEIYNIGSGEYLSNLNLIKKIINIMELEMRDSITFVKDRPGHDFRYAINFDKIRKLGWKPKKNIDNEIGKIINWYQENKLWWQKDYKNTLKSRNERFNISR